MNQRLPLGNDISSSLCIHDSSNLISYSVTARLDQCQDVCTEGDGLSQITKLKMTWEKFSLSHEWIDFKQSFFLWTKLNFDFKHKRN